MQRTKMCRGVWCPVATWSFSLSKKKGKTSSMRKPQGRENEPKTRRPDVKRIFLAGSGAKRHAIKQNSRQTPPKNPRPQQTTERKNSLPKIYSNDDLKKKPRKTDKWRRTTKNGQHFPLPKGHAVQHNPSKRERERDKKTLPPSKTKTIRRERGDIVVVVVKKRNWRWPWGSWARRYTGRGWRSCPRWRRTRGNPNHDGFGFPQAPEREKTTTNVVDEPSSHTEQEGRDHKPYKGQVFKGKLPDTMPTPMTKKP